MPVLKSSQGVRVLSLSPIVWVFNSIGVLSSIIAAVLGIIITVVSIVVQLAATRYSPAITEMFFRTRSNRAVFSLYIIGCVMGFWTAFAVNTSWVPRVSLIAMLFVATLGFLLMGPYFAFVFRFLAPPTWSPATGATRAPPRPRASSPRQRPVPSGRSAPCRPRAD